MAFLFRSSDTVEVVHRHDDAATPPFRDTVAPRWVFAAGQPAECSRVKVRGLGEKEQSELADADDSEWIARCIVAIDGKPLGDVSELLPAAKVELAELAAMAAAFPFSGRKLLDTATTDGES